MSSLPARLPGTRVLEEVDEALEPLYHLILLDDNEHTYDYVIVMLGKIFGYSREKAFAIACMVDNHGQAILMTAGHDAVTTKQNAIHSFGPDPKMAISKGSMSAIIEPAGAPSGS
jgi:ATP-dependent Clp protease adaptor protein ClpS